MYDMVLDCKHHLVCEGAPFSRAHVHAGIMVGILQTFQPFSFVQMMLLLYICNMLLLLTSLACYVLPDYALHFAFTFGFSKCPPAFSFRVACI
jgi:hypothetical protein